MLLLNLHNFKEINDSLGHYIGDRLLIEVGQRIAHTMGKKNTVARISGDEFGILIDDKNIEKIIHQLINKLSQVFTVGDNKIYTSCCIGGCCYPDDADNVTDLLKDADLALTHAKAKGSNCYEFFTQEMKNRVREKMKISQDLHVALKQQQFVIRYQPIICMLTGRVKKAEFLLRWQHPKRGLVSPEEFIQITEESGTIEEIGNWILEQVIDDVSYWRKNYQPDFQVSINTSPLYFREGNEQLDNWYKQLQKANLPGAAISLEITEHLLLDTGKHLTERLLMLRDAGIQVALDDFGTGYSSLAYLKKLDIDYLKIDKAFVDNLKPGSQEEALCEAIIVMAYKLNLSVIAEGIETEGQSQLLRYMACDYGQGFFFAKPLCKEDLEQYLKIDSSINSMV